MRSQAKYPKQLVSLANWFFARILILELILVFFLLLLIYINMKSDADLAWLAIVPIVFLGMIYYILSYADVGAKGLGKLLFKITTYSSSTAILAILLKYVAWQVNTLFFITAGLGLLASMILLSIMRYHNYNDKILSAELIIRVYLFSIVCCILYFVPNSELAVLGFAVKG